ncbi:MAG: sigma-54 dependent transcriptional regulator [Thermodesulforhabdaceae bacterium]|jgi:two-component system response regulator FlrC
MKIGVVKNQHIPVKDLQSEEHDVRIFSSTSELANSISSYGFDILFVPLQNPIQETAAIIDKIKTISPRAYLIALTDHPSVDDAMFLVKHGADDVWVVPTAKERFIKTVEWLKESSSPVNYTEDSDRPIISVSQKMKELIQLARRVANSEASVFIQGESGTGKELFARYIHKNSPRRRGPFISINCAAIPETLLESELFGYERGAFTGATRQKPGKFELAQGGTILLDEVTEIPIHLQAKLLRVLQEREVERIGGTRPIPLNVRIIATTNVVVEEKVKDGSFRKDLYYRLNVMPIKIPPLRERSEDIIPIAEYVLSKIAKLENSTPKELSQAAKDKLKKYSWPGNVRELENVIQRAHILAPSREILPQHILFDEDVRDLSNDESHNIPTLMPIREMERRLIYKALEVTNGNRTKAAEVLGITVRTLRNKLKEYGRSLDLNSK